jgi:glycosyltransferase involved in cell wall biosynthesis
LKKYEDRLNWKSELDRGQADALNKGFKIATGEIVGWLNSDDTYEPEALKTIVQFFNCRPDIDLLYGDCNIIDMNDKIIGIFEGGEFVYKKNLFNLKCTIPQPATFFRRDIFYDVGYLDTSYHYSMDFEFWLRITCKGKRMCHIPHKIANFRWYENSKSSNLFSKNVLIDENRKLQYKYNKLYYFLFGIKRNFLSPLKRGLVGKNFTINKKGKDKGTIIFFDKF